MKIEKYTSDQIEKLKNAIDRRLNGLRGFVISKKDLDDLRTYFNDILKPWDVYAD